MVCGERKGECLANSTDCPIMALEETQFSHNEASIAGGAVFTGYLESIRFRCTSTSSDVGLRFDEKKEWKALKQVESDQDICSSWKGNRAEVYGQDVATYATTAKMTIVRNRKKSICASGEINCLIKGYRVGTDLPTATVELLDGLGQRPAINYRPVNASMSSLSNEFLLGSIVRPMENGSFMFQSIRGFVPPGDYKLTVELDRMVMKNIGITVRIDNCSVGEIVSNTGICVDCSSTTYNFQLSANYCQPCPENGNCTSRVITPNDGYWQKTPCSDHIYRCLPTSACKFGNRAEKLTASVSNVTSCHFDEEWIEEDYARAQCVEVSCTQSPRRFRKTVLSLPQGHEGPLCGSCSKGYGSGLSSKCGECRRRFFSIAYIVLSSLFLLGLTGITVRGTLSALRRNIEQIHGERTAEPSGEAVQIHGERTAEPSGEAVQVPLLEPEVSEEYRHHCSITSRAP